MDADDSTASGPPSLGQILRLLPPGVLDVEAAPGGLDAEVADAVVFDPGEPPDAGAAVPGLILLAIGVDASSPGAEAAYRAADRACAAAVVLRRGAGAPDSGMLAAAAEGRTALLLRAAGQSWTELLGALRTALAHRGSPGPAEVGGLRLGDLPALANTVADLVGGAITIEDPQSRVLAYSRMDGEPDPLRRLTILGRQVPRWRVEELRESGFFRALWSTDDVLRLPADERYAERLAIAVRHGSEVLGSLWAAGDGRPLSEDSVTALRTAARAAVPHLMHHQSWGRAAALERERALRTVLDGGERATQAAYDLGLDPDRRYTVLVAEAFDGAGLASGEQAPEGPGEAEQRVLDVLALQVAAYRPGCVTARSGRRLSALLPAADGAGDPANRLLVTARSFPRSVVFAGVGPAARELSELPASREAAELIVRVLRERAAREPTAATSAAAAGDEVLAEAAALRLLDRVEPLWAQLSGPVHDLMAHDLAHGSEYGRSVAAYLDAFGDAARAAERLRVHPNTLRYRLRRARELFGMDLSDPTMRLLAEIGLRLAGCRTS